MRLIKVGGVVKQKLIQVQKQSIYILPGATLKPSKTWLLDALVPKSLVFGDENLRLLPSIFGATGRYLSTVYR